MFVDKFVVKLVEVGGFFMKFVFVKVDGKDVSDVNVIVMFDGLIKVVIVGDLFVVGIKEFLEVDVYKYIKGNFGVKSF